MKSLVHHIEHVRKQPHHVRKRVALTLAGAGAALVGVLWLGISLGTGAFAIHGSNFAESTGAEPSSAGSPSDTSQLAGAAAAVEPANAAAHIEIIDAATSSALSAPRTVQTVIPF